MYAHVVSANESDPMLPLCEAARSSIATQREAANTWAPRPRVASSEAFLSRDTLGLWHKGGTRHTRHSGSLAHSHSHSHPPLLPPSLHSLFFFDA